MKIKILIMIVIVFIVITAVMITTASSKENINLITKPLSQNSEQLIKDNNVRTFNKTSKNEPCVTDQLVNPDNTSLTDLIGPIHNEFGIRDDILKYIEENIPHWNKIARKAVITIAAEEQFLNYKAQTDQEAFNSSNRILIAMKCLAKEYPGTNGDYHIFKKIEELMSDTRERKLHIWEVNDKHFAGKHYKYQSISNKELEEKCESGNY